MGLSLLTRNLWSTLCFLILTSFCNLLLLVRHQSRETSLQSAISPLHRQNCTSPESAIPWELSGPVKSRTSLFSCGINSKTRLGFFLQKLSDKLLVHKNDCREMVVYGVAFGMDHMQYILEDHGKIDVASLIERHNRCFFMFVLEEDIGSQTVSADGLDWLVSFPRQVLPYTSMRRNAKILKYYGHFLFPFAETIVWQDAKFRRPDFVTKRPSDYTAMRQDACMSVVALPIHKNTFGKNNVRRKGYQPSFRDHCETVVDALKKRPHVTDSNRTLMKQCNLYEQDVPKKASLDRYLVDTGFIVWNFDSKECRGFNSVFQCTMSDQLQCHSDRDQVPFPFVLGMMGLHQENPGAQTSTNYLRLLDRSKASRVHITPSSCHWYFTALGNCDAGTDNPLQPEKGPTLAPPKVAVMVAGSLKRFFVNSTAQRVLKPLVQHNYDVDLFLFLTVAKGVAYRQELGYMDLIVPDPIFGSNPSNEGIKATIEGLVRKVGATPTQILIRDKVDLEASQLVRDKRMDSKALFPNEHVDTRFPMLDLRPKAVTRTIIGNQNMLKLFYSLQLLWESLVQNEKVVGKKYDYVLIVRDDTNWLQEFDLGRLVAFNQNADAYMLSCDARNPPMMPQELNDHAVLIKREKADVMGRYLSSLISANLEDCHSSVHSVLGELRGCNSEMILRWIVENNNITVQDVPQSLMPMQRMVRVQKDGSMIECFHKFCQSHEKPLMTPVSVQECKELFAA